MKKPLSVFCLESHKLISGLRGQEKLITFFKFRYRLLRKEYHHEPFSVEQADYDFFLTTYRYLVGELNLSAIIKSDYNDNYIRWIKANQAN